MKTNDILTILGFCVAGFLAVKFITKQAAQNQTATSSDFSSAYLKDFIGLNPYTVPNLNDWQVTPQLKDNPSGAIYL